MKTKLQVFAAYYPYRAEVAFLNSDQETVELTTDILGSIDDGTRYWTEEYERDTLLVLRPLSALQTPMQHPVTGEEIENPAAWIAKKTCGNGRFICDYLTTYNMITGKIQSRQIDALALELHFDIYGAIEAGWAVEVQG